MKKVLCLAVLAAVGYVLYTKYLKNREEQDLWAEVTDAVDD
ncbi:MAG: DLW-39 family protein [Micrococcales bacterium]|nr:DLW-39 family protein [Micrococcales bacterium]